MKKVKIEIHGMHCASCAANLERSFKKVKGIRDARVSLLLKKAIIECEENVGDEELANAVKRAGYKANRIIHE